MILQDGQAVQAGERRTLALALGLSRYRATRNCKPDLVTLALQ